MSEDEVVGDEALIHILVFDAHIFAITTYVFGILLLNDIFHQSSFGGIFLDITSGRRHLAILLNQSIVVVPGIGNVGLSWDIALRVEVKCDLFDNFNRFLSDRSPG